MSESTRFEAALHSANPFEALRQLALDLAGEGHSPEAVLQLFDNFRAMLRISERDHDEDIVLDVMDCIVGWCSEHAKLFPSHKWKQQ